MKIRTAVGTIGGLALLSGAAAFAAEILPGPIPAEVTEIVDGDTLRVRARIWLGHEVETLVRLAGIDTPELRGKCDHEKKLAQAARDYLAALTGPGATVALHDVQFEKFAGRVMARVTTPDGHDLGLDLEAAGKAVRYDGGQRSSWCG